MNFQKLESDFDFLYSFLRYKQQKRDNTRLQEIGIHSTLTFWSLFSVHKYWTLKVKLNLNWIIFEFHDFFMKIACTYNSQSFYCWFLKLVAIDLYFSLLTYYLFGSFVSQRFIISFLSISFWLNFVRQTWNIQTDANLYVIYLTAVHQIIVENVWISCF